MKNTTINICLLFVSLVFGFLFLEGMAQWYIATIAQQGKLFETDSETGWKVKPRIDIQRTNSDGEIWTIKTDEQGFREKHVGEIDNQRILILGDSFAFGEGVDIEDRFDVTLSHLGYSIVNTGVMGFGTDQQFIKAKPYLPQMKKGDIVLVLTFFNDFYDLSLRRHSGRAKPWYDIKDDQLQFHKPNITILEILRDQSYIFAKVSSLWARHRDLTDADVTLATQIYQRIMIRESDQLASQAVLFLVGYHGIPLVKKREHRNLMEQTFRTICRKKTIHCINFDVHLDFHHNPEYFLTDGHWNKKGHGLVGRLLAKIITDLTSSTTPGAWPSGL